MMPAEVEMIEERQSQKLPEISFTDRAFSSDSATGSALWQSVAGDWVLLKCGCAEGFDAGSPPQDSGKYEGEIVRKLCEPAAH
jgi:hypothetical protein